jgi:hemolysin activation/secretion protein
VSLATTIDSQYSEDELFSTETLYVGGEYSVRGFKDESTQGDSGFYVRNDLSFVLPQIFKNGNRWLAAFTPSLFVDYGRVFPNATARAPESLAGAGAKIAFRYGMFDTAASYAKILKKEDWMTEDSAFYAYMGLSGRF